MLDVGRKKFSAFEARPRTIYHYFFHFGLQREVPNFEIPPIGRDIRITNLKGEPICIGRRTVRRGRFRLIYQKMGIQDQLEHAFELLDTCFLILNQVMKNFKI